MRNRGERLQTDTCERREGCAIENRIYGYVRVSSRDQNERRQLVALEPFQIPPEQIYVDRLSGKDFNRPQYQRLVKCLKEDDLLIVKSIDRLGRNYEEIQEQWRYITKVKKAHIMVLDMPLLDTRKQDGNLTGMFIADLVLQILSYVAQTERENIHQRQREGIQAAKARGIRFGRPPIAKPEEYPQLRSRILEGNITVKTAAGILGVSDRTLRRWLRGDGLRE